MTPELTEAIKQLSLEIKSLKEEVEILIMTTIETNSRLHSINENLINLIK